MEKKRPLTPASAKRMTIATTNREDLVVNLKKGIAYQTDRTNPVAYDDAYYEKTAGKTLKDPINKIRKAIVDKYLPEGKILDYGCGDCAFIEYRGNTHGYDVCEKTIKKLHSIGKYHNFQAEGFTGFDGITFFDSLEHIAEPSVLLKKVGKQMLFIAMPIISDLTKLKQWKHYRPNEHFFYFTNNGFIDMMDNQGFVCVEVNEDETLAGREDIYTFVFRRK